MKWSRTVTLYTIGLSVGVYGNRIADAMTESSPRFVRQPRQ